MFLWWRFRESCAGKQVFRRYAHARLAARRTAHRHAWPFQVYPCRLTTDGHHWHIGSATAKAERRREPRLRLRWHEEEG